MNDLMESVSEYFQSNATRSYGEKIADANLAVTIAMSYIAVAASVVVNIFVSRKMRYRFLMLVVFGFLFLPLYVHLEPDMFYVVQFFVGVVVTATIAKNGDYKQAADNVRYKQDEERIVYQSAYRVKLQAGACLLAVVAIVQCCFLCLFHRRIITTDIPIPHGNRAQKMRCRMSQCSELPDYLIFMIIPAV